MALLCYRVFAPFLKLTVWALILAVVLYPLHRTIARRLKDKQGLSATLLVFLGIVLLVVSTAVQMNSPSDTLQCFIASVQSNSVDIPSPPDGVAAWPLVGKKLHETWSRAHDDLPGLVQTLQPKIGELAKVGLAFVASIAAALLSFLGSFILAGIFMAFGEPGARACQAIVQRIAGKERGEEFTGLAAATIRPVAQASWASLSSRPFWSAPPCWSTGCRGPGHWR